MRHNTFSTFPVRAAGVLLMVLLTLTAFVTFVEGVAPAGTAAYDPVVSRRALQYSKASSCSATAIRTWSCGSACSDPSTVNFTVTEVLTPGPTQAFAGVDHARQQLVLAFRASDNEENWVANLDYDLIPCDYGANCEAHKGFIETYNYLYLGVRRLAVQLAMAYPTYTWLITGHSLGGALATLAMADLTLYLPTTAAATALAKDNVSLAPATDPSRMQMYSFESPRVGNGAFVVGFEQIVSGPHFRITQQRDPVPHLPPRSFGFRHVPHEIWYDKDTADTYKVCADTAQKEDRKCSNSVLPLNPSDHAWVMAICADCGCNGKKAAWSLTWSSISRLIFEFYKYVFE